MGELESCAVVVCIGQSINRHEDSSLTHWPADENLTDLSVPCPFLGVIFAAWVRGEERKLPRRK